MLCGDDSKKRQLLLPGGGFSAIYAPDGQLMNEPLPEGTEGIVYADVTRPLLDRTPRERVVIRERALSDGDVAQPASQRSDEVLAAPTRPAA